MKNKFILSLIFLSFCATNIYSQTEVFPDNLNFQPFAANTLEPKLGFLFHVSENQLRLDIGNSIDIVKINYCNGGSLSFGADLFTYTFLRGESNFHFPVDAVDYLFGINAAYKTVINGNEVGARLRLSHISAHFVDGHYDGNNDAWIDGREPIVYSREFFELMPYYKIDNLRLYFGVTYIYHVDPEELGNDSYQIGFDYYHPEFITKNLNLFCGYDLKLVNLYSRTANHTFNAGIKYGKPNGKGVTLYLQYYNGKNIHGEYFDLKSDYTAVGLNLDL